MKKVALVVAALLLVAGVALWLSQGRRVDTGVPAGDGQLGGVRASQAKQKATSLPVSSERQQGRVYLSRKAFSLKGDWTVPEGSVQSVLDRLKTSADAGNAASAYEIFLKLRECQTFLAYGFDEELAEAYKKAGAEEGYLSSTERTVRDCANAAAVLKQSSPGDWLEKAADSGLLDAQLMYASDWRAVLGSPQNMLKDPGRVVRYKEKAMRFLTSAAADGSIDALMLIHGEYEAGTLTPKDPVRAYAYFYALQKTAPQFADDRQRQRYLKQLTPEQLKAANQIGESVYKQCCQ